MFAKEKDFEEKLIETLQQNGWEDKVLKYPTEEDLINNWANIIFENNRSIDCLNDQPLTKSEMEQIIQQIGDAKTSVGINRFINGETINITRDNPDDPAHLGKVVTLSIFKQSEIAAGKSRYQIAQQPIFKRKSTILNDRRGDFMLLINGMPVIHIELKKSGIPISQAYNQIKKYSHEGLFDGIYSLVQVFVAMNPEDCVYFANPGKDGKFNEKFYFHWADYNNEQLNDWKSIATKLLSIPMAHQLIGYYTIADKSDNILKVMRSYQYYAASAIAIEVSRIDWGAKEQRGGYIWHTTGSGKTMTSFKSAQLISKSKNADKVVFLMDRIELGTQSLHEYLGFKDDRESIQSTENTIALIERLRSDKSEDTLIVTSIQKMSRIYEDGGINQHDIDKIRSKRIVFIVDEAHRSTFGEMLITIKETFPEAVFFGFTGTPIYDENNKKDSTTATIFGNELHRYTLGDGIRDGNVLGFDPYKCCTYKDIDLRRVVALEKASAKSEEEALHDPEKRKIYDKYMRHVPMARKADSCGEGIEDYINAAQYDRDEHREKVVEDIAENWQYLSVDGKFHAILATASIPEAIRYYRLLKEKCPNLKVTALFHPDIDNDGDKSLEKEDGLAEIMTDYNKMYDKKFDFGSHDSFKKDVSARMSHKGYYSQLSGNREQKLDIMIVVDQMLTGFDSKWVNTLYLDKEIKYENIIQAFSRTNRVFGYDKPFGVVRYYRKPHTMERNIATAVQSYSGDRKVDLFVERLPFNLKEMEKIWQEIKELYEGLGIVNFERLPEDDASIEKFAKLFVEFNKKLEAGRVQGFSWQQTKYYFKDNILQKLINSSDEVDGVQVIEVTITEREYKILLQRYKEIERIERKGDEKPPFEISGYLTEIDTGKIDDDYMNSQFQKYLRELLSEEDRQKRLADLHKSFANLSQEEQKIANLFIHDVDSGSVTLVEGKTFRDYITEYQIRDKKKQVDQLHKAIGIDESLVMDLLYSHVTEQNINENGRLEKIEETIDKEKAKAYLEKREGKSLPKFMVIRDAAALLREFILKGGYDIYKDIP